MKNQRNLGLLWWSIGKDSTLPLQETWEWQPTPVLWARESHGQRSLAGYSPWGHRESDTTEAMKHVRTQCPSLASACQQLFFCLPVPQCKGNLLQSSFPSLWHLPPGVGQALNSRPCLQCFGISIKLKQISIFMSFQEPPVVLLSF